jgi:hypothetical protein
LIHFYKRSTAAMMKWLLVLTSALACLALVSAETYTEEEEEGDARLGYVSVGSDGTTSITFNATSIQNAVILGLFVLVLGALVLPLFGISLGGLFGSDSDTGYGYGYEQPAYTSDGYDVPASSYQSFSKRSIDAFGPILDALKAGEEKYEN